MLVSKNTKSCVTPNGNANICVTPNANPQRKQVEYAGADVGHVDFMLFVSFLVALGTQCKRDIQWNTVI